MTRHFLIQKIFAQMPKFAVGNIEKRKRQNRRGPPSNVVNQILCQKGQVFSQVLYSREMKEYWSLISTEHWVRISFPSFSGNVVSLSELHC